MEVRIGRRVGEAEPAFEDRTEAGRRLAEWVEPRGDGERIVLGLPRGGVPVAASLAEALGAPLGLALARKLPVPASPEMGFGAVALDGTTVLNADVMATYHISREESEAVAREVREEVRRRAREYTGLEQPPDVRGRRVYLVDDGLATGYSVMAAARMLRAGGAESLVLAVPCAPLGTLRAVAPSFDEAWCLYAQDRGSFAVASFYRWWADLTDDEVVALLREAAPAAPGTS